jgi:ATP-grasp ribosomal peptide maturase
MGPSPVLAVTALGDVTADLVLKELHERGIPVVQLDPGTDFAADARMSAYLDTTGLTGNIDTATRHVNLNAVRSVYWRRPSSYVRPGTHHSADESFVLSQARAGFGAVLASLPGALYVNHPWRNRIAEYKAAQLAVAARLGMSVPRTLITTVPEDARRFVADHARAVYKPLRAVHTPDTNGARRTVWVRTVDPDELDDGVAACPHLFQACVPKIADIRLTAVADRLFATRIDIDGDHLDWREDYSVLSYTPLAVPPVIRSAVVRYLNAFGLVFGAFDFALAQDHQWWFLECNPNGQWAFVDNATCDAVAAALADTLQKGATT